MDEMSRQTTIEAMQHFDRIEHKIYNSEDWDRYATVLHIINRVLGLDTPIKALVFATVEGLSRGRYQCTLNENQMLEYIYCGTTELREVIEEMTRAGILEQSTFRNRPSLKLTPPVRAITDRLRSKLRAKRAGRYARPKR
jgi:hypothetical protein